jgi:hypothetical protein
MAKLTIKNGEYFVGKQKLASGMGIRRYDGGWYEGEVGGVSGYDQKGERVTELCLVVEGYAPSPLQAGDTIEIV